jgi:hypothetical protein
LDISSGAVQQWNVPIGLNDPFTGTQLTLTATSVLDPVRGDRLLVPMSNDGLYEVAFDPATGSFPNATPLRLSNDGVAAIIDGLTFDGDGDLHVATRDTASIGSLREFTQAELAAAAAGSSFAILDKTGYYTAADARGPRDVMVVVPEPAVGGLLIAAVACFASRRRRAAGCRH